MSHSSLLPRRRRRLPVLLTLTATLLVISASAQTAPPPATRAFVAGTLADNGDPPVIDGRVNDSIWQGVKPYAEFTQQDPTEGAPATERTEVRLIVGRGHVYVDSPCLAARVVQRVLRV